MHRAVYVKNESIAYDVAAAESGHFTKVVKLCISIDISSIVIYNCFNGHTYIYAFTFNIDKRVRMR